MPRGRPKLTERDKLNRKLERLQKEIERIRTELVNQFPGETIETKKEDRPFIEKGV